MKKIARSLVAAAIVGASVGAVAAVSTGASPFQVAVPKLTSGLNFNIEADYFQPTNSDLAYLNVPLEVVQDTSKTPCVTFPSHIYSLDPNYNFGFTAGIGYVFPCSGNDIHLNWIHFDQSTKEHIDDAKSTDQYLSHVFKRLDADFKVTANSEATFKHDAVDLDVGQYLDVGTRMRMRFYGGLRYAQLRKDVDNQVTVTGTLNDPKSTHGGIISGASAKVSESYRSKFTGIGPHVGISTNYRLTRCFGISTNFAGSLLVGRSEASATSTSEWQIKSNPVSMPIIEKTERAADNTTRVVPAFDAKLGLDYTQHFNCGKSTFTVEAGYRVMDYIDALDRLPRLYPELPVEFNPTSGDVSVNPLDRYSADQTGVVTSSVGFNGPYIALHIQM